MCINSLLFLKYHCAFSLKARITIMQMSAVILRSMQAMRYFASQYEIICHIDYTLSFAPILPFSHLLLQIKNLFIYLFLGERGWLQITSDPYSPSIIIVRQCPLPNDVCFLNVIMLPYTDVFYRRELFFFFFLNQTAAMFCCAGKSSCYNDASAAPGADTVAKDLALLRSPFSRL